MRLLIKKKDKRAVRAGKLLEKKESMLNTLLVANELVNILLSAILTAVALELFGSSGVGIATIVATVLLLIFGEITPKSVSTRHPDAIAYALSGFVKCVSILLHPFVRIFTFVSHIVLRILGINMKKQAKSYTEEEIKSIIDVGGEEGVLEKSEHSMMHRVFQFTDLAAQDIMVPRTSIIAIPYTITYRDIIELAQRTRLSRFPVYKTDIDDIIGVLYVKDLLSYTGIKKEFSVQNTMRPPLFILGTKKMSSVQEILNDNRQSLAIVVDEYSGTDGILTKEDITYEIFGPITHTVSLHSQANQVQTQGDTYKVVTGTARLSELSEELHIPLQSDINETIGGWLAERLDHLPEEGESVVYSGYRFTVTKAKKRRVEEVHIEQQEAEDA